MKIKFLKLVIALVLIIPLSSCSTKQKEVYIGVSFGVGEAVRWEKEKGYMEEAANKLGIKIETRLNKTDMPLTQTEDCIEMIDSGIDVLILIPRDAFNVDEILDYAKKKNVPVISYARTIMNNPIDLIVGYDSNRIGQSMGQYLSETAYQGDYILLSGDPNDNNALDLYNGAMRYLEPIKDNINIILDASVPNWSADEAKTLVRDAIISNHGNVDAILAPNDKIAGACAEVIKEFNMDHPVIITGMDAELDAIKRIVNGEQNMTLSLDLKELANVAIQEAYNVATGNPTTVNSEIDTGYAKLINAHLITGKVIVKENIDKEIIEAGIYTHAEVYGN